MNSAIPAEVGSVIMRALAKDPADRWSDGEALATALREAVDPSARRAAPATSGRHGPRLLLPALLLGVAAIATLAFSAFRRDGTLPEAPETPTPTPPSVPSPVPAPVPLDLPTTDSEEPDVNSVLNPLPMNAAVFRLLPRSTNAPPTILGTEFIERDDRRFHQLRFRDTGGGDLRFAIDADYASKTCGQCILGDDPFQADPVPPGSETDTRLLRVLQDWIDTLSDEEQERLAKMHWDDMKGRSDIDRQRKILLHFMGDVKEWRLTATLRE